jgi:hypothetical protein
MRPITCIERNDFCHTWAANIFTPLFRSTRTRVCRDVSRGRATHGISTIREDVWLNTAGSPTGSRGIRVQEIA